MSIKDALYKYLSSDVALAERVGTRIYPHTAPSHAPLPYITLQRLGTVGEQHLLAPSGLARLSMQVDCWASDSPTLEQVSEAVRLALDGFRSSAVGAMHGVDVRRVMVANELDTYEPPDDGSQRGTYRTILDLDIWHRR